MGPAPPPRADRQELGRRTMSLEAAGLAAIAVIAGAMLLWMLERSTTAAVVGFLLVGLLVLDGIRVRRALVSPRLQVQAPPAATAGAPVSMVVQLAGVGLPARLQTPFPMGTAVARLPDGRAGLLVIAGRSRGVTEHILGRLSVVGPFAMFRSTRRVRVWFAVPMVIGPAPLRHEVTWPITPSLFQAEEPTRSVIGDDTFRSVRDYVRGDPRRRVHWKATAHRGSLMVRENDGTGVTVVRVVVDVVFSGPAAEEAYGRAMYLITEALRVGWVVQLVTVEAEGGAEVFPVDAPIGMGAPGTDLAAHPPVGAAARLVTVAELVRTPHETRSRLAAAVPGRPVVPEWRGLTRHITDEVDRWS